MARRYPTVLLALLLLTITWLHERPVPANTDSILSITPLGLPAQDRKGPFRLTGLWQLTSPNTTFGGYSALVRIEPGRFLAFSDRGTTLSFAAPGSPAGPVAFGRALPIDSPYQRNRDVESAAWHAESGHLWLGIEGGGSLVRLVPGKVAEAVRKMPEWQHWGSNAGPEALVRLSDGRFVVLCECRSGWFEQVNHPALVYSGDLLEGAAGQAFTFAGAAGYRPTDMAELPDGRVLAWIMSDENEAVSQRVLLLRLEFRLEDLPPKQKAPG